MSEASAEEEATSGGEDEGDDEEAEAVAEEEERESDELVGPERAPLFSFGRGMGRESSSSFLPMVLNCLASRWTLGAAGVEDISRAQRLSFVCAFRRQQSR